MEQRCCSQCGAVLELSAKEASLGYGPVIKKCPRCGKFYYEDRLKEISIQGIKKSDKFILRPNVFISSLLCIVIGAVMTAVLIFAIANGVRRIRGIALIGPIMIIVGFFTIIKEFFTYLKRLSNLKKEQKESYERLNDPFYRQLLFLALPPDTAGRVNPDKRRLSKNDKFNINKN